MKGTNFILRGYSVLNEDPGMPFKDMETNLDDFQIDSILEVQCTSGRRDENGPSSMSIDLTMDPQVELIQCVDTRSKTQVPTKPLVANHQLTQFITSHSGNIIISFWTP
jgi:hypothetical protein